MLSDKEVFEEILADSDLLQVLESEISDEEMDPIVQEKYDKIVPLYQGDSPNDDTIIEYIDAASYLGCTDKLLELLIILHFNPDRDQLSMMLNPDEKIIYDEISEDTIYHYIIKHDRIDLLKSDPNFHPNETYFIYAIIFNYT